MNRNNHTTKKSVSIKYKLLIPAKAELVNIQPENNKVSDKRGLSNPYLINNIFLIMLPTSTETQIA